MPDVYVVSERTQHGYARVVASPRRQTLRRGSDIARELGWPQERTGIIGTIAGLLDLGAPFRRPKSMTRVVRHHREETNRAIEAHMLSRREELVEH